jgi:hypothetical protein
MQAQEESFSALVDGELDGPPGPLLTRLLNDDAERARVIQREARKTLGRGTPGGVGMKRTPPLFMKPGDVAEVEVSGVGVLRNPIIQEA